MRKLIETIFCITMQRGKMIVEVFYDVVSPYTYFAFETLERYKNFWSLSIRYRPFFLGGVMHASGNKPPGTVPAKAMYMMQDVQRISDYLGITCHVPPNFPVNTLLAARVLTAVKIHFPDKLVPLSRTLFKAVFEKNKDISNLEELTSEVATKFSEEETKKILQLASSPEIKQKLKETTDEAVAIGAFGAPTMIWKTDENAEGEMFFGSDRFHIIAHKFGLKYIGPNPENAKL